MIREYEAAAAEFKGLTSPLRIACLALVAEGESTPIAAFARLRESDTLLTLPGVSYHFRQLAKRNMIELTHVVPVRGTERHYYAATERGQKFLDFIEGMP